MYLFWYYTSFLLKWYIIYINISITGELEIVSWVPWVVYSLCRTTCCCFRRFWENFINGFQLKRLYCSFNVVVQVQVILYIFLSTLLKGVIALKPDSVRSTDYISQKCSVTLRYINRHVNSERFKVIIYKVFVLILPRKCNIMMNLNGLASIFRLAVIHY